MAGRTVLVIGHQHMGEHPTNFRETNSKATRGSKTGKIWHVRKKQWVEEQNGEHERRNSEEDVGDLLLGVGEVLWEFSHSKKGKRERQRRRSSSRTGTKLDILPGKETNPLSWNSFGCYGHTNTLPCHSKR